MYIESDDRINFICGELPLSPKIKIAFDALVIEFLDTISKAISKNKSINEFKDLKTFGFWCRKKNIIRLSEESKRNKIMVGRGVVLHITPSNVALNFSYSLAFGLLAGNCNIVRLPSRNFHQVILLCNIIIEILKQDFFKELRNYICLIKYERSDKISSALSKIANARVIWGGDETILQFKKYSTIPRCVDIMFSNRYSISIINPSSIKDFKDDSIIRLINKFYNDSYLMDQQGCSSPHLLIWLGKNNQKVQEIFWNTLNNYVSENYQSDLAIANEKIIDISINAAKSEINYRTFFKNFKLVRNVLSDNFHKVQQIRGKFGVFSEIMKDNLDEIIPIITNDVQTITYFGINKDEIKNLIIDNGLLGIDRVVPIGRAFDMGPFWDGFDVIQSLSRTIEN